MPSFGARVAVKVQRRAVIFPVQCEIVGALARVVVEALDVSLRLHMGRRPAVHLRKGRRLQINVPGAATSTGTGLCSHVSAAEKQKNVSDPPDNTKKFLHSLVG